MTLPPSDAAIMVTGLPLTTGARLAHTTAEVLTERSFNGNRLLVLYGDPGAKGELRLDRLTGRPTVVHADAGFEVREDDGAAFSVAFPYEEGLLALETREGERIDVLVTTLTFGISISAYELMRSRLEAATLTVRTKERDEAEARRAAIEAQLASLESRVQPHFLFNTLNSIASLIPSDPRGAERMTAQLASLLRSSLDAANAPLTTIFGRVASGPVTVSCTLLPAKENAGALPAA